MRRHWAKGLALGGMALLLAGCGQVKPGMRAGRMEDRMRQASRDGLGPDGAMVDVISKGNPQAKVRVEAYYPLNQRHRRVADLLLSFAEKYPGQVYVRLADWRSERGKKLWYASGLTCGGIQINGKSEVTLKGKKEPVSFLQQVDVYWTQPELEAAVAQAVAEAKAGAPEKEKATSPAPGSRKPSGES